MKDANMKKIDELHSMMLEQDSWKVNVRGCQGTYGVDPHLLDCIDNIPHRSKIHSI